MGGERRMWRVATRAAVAAGGVAVFVSLSCGAPLGPAPHSWQTLATFRGDQYNIENIAADGEAVFFTYDEISGGTPPRIRRFQNGEVNTAFILDFEGADRAMIKDMAIANGNGWAVGARGYSSTETQEPFLIRYESNQWRGMEISGMVPEVVLHSVAPITRESCWLLVSKEWFPGRGPLRLWKYERGYLVEYRSVKAEAVVYDADTGTTFALALKNGVQVLISPDDGVTWFEEKVTFEKPWPNYGPDRISACTANGVLYVATTDSNGDPIASTVYRRVGPPGAGEYELLLYCPVGPNFGEIDSVAVDDRGRVLAVGRWTSAYYDGLSWAQESLPKKNHFYDITVGANGFYAAANDENWNLEILYHP